MSDNKSGCLNGFGAKENVCMDVSRILDSCRDKDCFEDVKVFLNDFGREIIENASSVRAKSTKILAANITVDPVQFNRGFYQIYIRYFVKVVCEACVGMGKSREFDGLAVCEKNVILYGSEGNVSIFKSEMGMGNSSCGCNTTMSTNLPTVAVEVIDPVILNTKIAEECNCCCCCCSAEEVPETLSEMFGGSFEDSDNGNGKNLYVSLGFFSVIRIERPGQYIVSATEFSVPDKECIMTQPDDPCQAFAKMSFPVNEFNPPSLSCNRKCQ